MNESLPGFWDVSPSTCETADRRREPRFPTSVRVEVEIQKPPAQKVQGTVLEVSRSGLRLELPLAVEGGTRVKINFKHVIISCEIKHCQPARTGFNAGVFVKEVSGPERFDQLDDGELDLYAILVQVVQLG